MKKTSPYKLDLGYLLDINHETPAIYDLKDRFQHAYIIGATRMGKSVLMEHMAVTDLNYGLSLCYIDPKGESVDRLYHLAENKDKIKYVSIDHPLIINPLKKKGYEPNQLISEFVQIVEILISLISPANAPPTTQMREIMSMVFKMLKDEDKNLDFFVKFLLYENVRKSYKKTTKDNDVLDYWNEFDAWDKNIKRNKEKIESAKRVAGRLFEICDGVMKNFVIGENELYISELLAEGKSLFVNTARMSRPERIYLSNLIVYAVVSYMNYEKKHDYPLIMYIDEMQLVASKLFSDILAMGASAQVGFVLAMHDFEEIDVKVLSSVFGNCQTFIGFRCGDKEAQRMANIYGLKDRDFLNLKKYTAYIRLGVDNVLIETFPPLLTKTPEISLPIKEKSKPINFLRSEWISF